MTTTILKGTSAVPEPTALRLRGTQTDAYGTVMGGDRALFDFALAGTPDTIVSGSALSNLIAGAGSGSLTFTASGVDTKKGIGFTTGGDYRAYVSDGFNPAAMGSAPSFLISAWLTAQALANISGVACCSDGNTAGATAWRWLTTGSGGENLNMMLSDGTDFHVVTVPGLEVDVPHLFTMFCEKIGASSYRLRGYRDAALAATVNGVYPVPNPTRGPNFGNVPGQAAQQQMYLHRARCRKIDPDFFDIDAYLAEEIAANGSRFS